MILEISQEIDPRRRGESIPGKERALVAKLQSQAFEIQRRFALAEQSALLLDQMLDPVTGISESIARTYASDRELTPPADRHDLELASQRDSSRQSNSL